MPLRTKLRKPVAATFLVIFLTNLLTPSVTYALTSGPTQPEATSFEPIDTTDMVNIQSGDFNYNIPLLNVPGPEGGYPLTLSYHAGIQPDEDASWVGLGWSLNTGAINRSVNGYPDDWNGLSSSNHSFWAGGSSQTYNVGVSVGIANCATIGAGLAFSSDTYRGFGVGYDVSVTVGKSIGSASIGGTVGMGVNPDGDGYMFGSAGIGIGRGVNASVGVSFITTDKSIEGGLSGGIGFSAGATQTHQGMSGSILGASISTAGNKPSLSVGGMTSSVHNANAGNISTSSHGWSVDIPVYYGLNLALGYSKQRYWTNETASVQTNGSLWFNSTGTASNGSADQVANDEYSLLEDPSYKSILDNPDPKTVQGGSFFDYDVYSVNAQGLAGNMRPYVFQGSLWNQNIYNGATPLVKYYAPNVPNGMPSFRFENDFSNRYTQNYLPYSDPSWILNNPPFDANPIEGFNDGQGHTDGNFGYGFTGFKNGLVGSKHIVTDPTIHARNPLGYLKTDRQNGSQIEGFSITNESGVTYHFALPAYSFNEEAYQEPINQVGGASGNRLSKANAYAYTWYLTTITGPDFVDRNSNGIADDGDWGYWVDFEYGKWSNKYNWRNPSEGFHRDEDNQWQNCSIGTREVYYLNAVRTRSHVALFEKDIRYDGKSTSPESFYKTTVSGIGDAGYQNQGLYNVNSSQSLRLSKIYLLNASDEGLVSATASGSGTYKPTTSRSVACSDCELSNNILDKADIDAAGRNILESKSLRIIDFNQDYSLCQNTTNSFDINYPTSKFGKLTLLNIVNRGKGGVNLMPPVIFNYDQNVEDQVSQSSVTLTSSSFTTTNGNFKVGDLINSNSLSVYCGVITARNLVGSNYVYTLANGNYTGSSTTANVNTTKNPPYNKNAYDSWGLYKSNFNMTTIAANENLGRITDGTSAQGLDAWSLQSLTSQLGGKVKIDYEPDQISTVGISYAYPYILNSIGVDGAQNKIRFTVNTNGYAITDLLNVGDVNGIVFESKYNNPGDHGPAYLYKSSSYNYTVTSIDVDGTVHANLDVPVPSMISSYPYQSSTSGNVACTQNLSYGGGLRVKNMKIVNPDGGLFMTSYGYNNPSTAHSSGTTSYLPTLLDVFDNVNINSVYQYKAALYKNVNSLYSIAREIPAPAVMYEYVTVSNQIKNADEANIRNLDSKTQYQFEVFRKNMAGISDVTGRTGPVAVSGYGNMYSRNLVLQKFTESIGNLKSIIKFDNSTPGRKISETINHYLHDGLEQLSLDQFMTQYKSRLSKFYYQGFLQERIEEVKNVQNQVNTDDNGIKATCSARESYPCVQTGQTVINYINGTQTSTSNLGFDFYSGAVTSKLETDAYGNNLITEYKPAYRMYPGNSTTPGMGFKWTTGYNKNMLTQVAATYTWKADNNLNKIGLVSASANTWSNGLSAVGIDGNQYTQNSTSFTIGMIWRPQSTYDWMALNQTADGVTPLANFSDFNYNTPSSSDPNWKMISNVSLYDVYSKPLEAADINGSSAATKMSYGENKIILTGSPAKFYELAFSSAEDAAVSQTNNMFVKAGDATVSTTVYHTGAKSLLLGTSGKKGFLYSVPTSNLTIGRPYQASVWVKPQSGSATNVKLQYDINGTVKTVAGVNTAKTANGWYLINLLISGSDIAAGSNTLNVYCINNDASVQCNADDFRFQPLNAQSNAYVYDPFSGELTYVLNNNNIYTRFSYDGLGKLIGTFKEKLGVGEYKMNDYQYNYSSAKYPNDLIQNVTYSKNNCGAGYNASTTNVTVPAGMFNSFISLADANAMANAYAQDYANTHGTCTQLAAITANNNVHVSGFVALYTNLSTGLTYNFSIPAGGGALGYIPVGNYSLTILKSGNSTTYAFDPGCGGTATYSGSSGNFNPIAVTVSNCKTILINYPL